MNDLRILDDLFEKHNDVIHFELSIMIEYSMD